MRLHDIEPEISYGIPDFVKNAVLGFVEDYGGNFRARIFPNKIMEGYPYLETSLINGTWSPWFSTQNSANYRRENLQYWNNTWERLKNGGRLATFEGHPLIEIVL